MTDLLDVLRAKSIEFSKHPRLLELCSINQLVGPTAEQAVELRDLANELIGVSGRVSNTPESDLLWKCLAAAFNGQAHDTTVELLFDLSSSNNLYPVAPLYKIESVDAIKRYLIKWKAPVKHPRLGANSLLKRGLFEIPTTVLCEAIFQYATLLEGKGMLEMNNTFYQDILSIGMVDRTIEFLREMHDRINPSTWNYLSIHSCGLPDQRLFEMLVATGKFDHSINVGPYIKTEPMNPRIFCRLLDLDGGFFDGNGQRFTELIAPTNGTRAQSFLLGLAIAVDSKYSTLLTSSGLSEKGRQIVLQILGRPPCGKGIPELVKFNSDYRDFRSALDSLLPEDLVGLTLTFLSK